ncbi:MULTISPECIES: hypothetical protein [Flavobacterium]|uniref:hypothetical protein n=1 Tax=Flavobacterium TaxID=237 RepID=UPI002114358E|nr:MULTISPECIES: hypothetical protein [Flavobacterium]UUF16246.1 hypothetical protein NLJ00_09005 [Flavobacterium panici]
MKPDKTLAIKYTIFKVAQEYLKFHGQPENNVDYFNENNNFNLDKCILLPYIITIANGKKDKLLNGVFNHSFFPDLEKNDGIFICELKDNKATKFTSKDLDITFNDNQKLVFNFNSKDFESLDPDIKQSINHSVEFIIKRRYPDFANFNYTLLKEICYDNDAFEYFMELKETGELNGLNEIKIIEKFQEIVLQFPFFISYMKEIEKEFEYSK